MFPAHCRPLIHRLFPRGGQVPTSPKIILAYAGYHILQTPNRAFSRLRIPDTSTLPPHTQQTIQKHHNDNWTRALALNPDTLRRFVTHYEDLFSEGTTRLHPADRELLAVVVSAANGCGFCRAHHTLGLAAALGGGNGDDARTSALLKAKKIALDWHIAGDLSAREKALAGFAERLALKPRDVGRKEIEDLKAHGFSDEEVLEVIEVVGWFAHSNRLMIALGVEIDDRYLQ